MLKAPAEAKEEEQLRMDVDLVGEASSPTLVDGLRRGTMPISPGSRGCARCASFSETLGKGALGDLLPTELIDTEVFGEVSCCESVVPVRAVSSWETVQPAGSPLLGGEAGLADFTKSCGLMSASEMLSLGEARMPSSARSMTFVGRLRFLTGSSASSRCFLNGGPDGVSDGT